MSLGEAIAFIARPVYRDTRDPVDAEGLRHLLVLFLLSVLAVFVVMGVVWPIILSANGGEAPANANDALAEMNPGRMVLMVVVLAPLIEELLFRSWLGAPRACLYGLPVVAALTAVMMGGGSASGAFVLPVAAVLGFLAVAVIMRARSLSDAGASAMRDTLFPWAFWGSAIVFAALHLANFTDGITTPLLLLAVLPQCLLGLVLGYVRMRFGLAPAIGFHGGYNALAVTLSLLAGGLGDAANNATAIALLF